MGSDFSAHGLVRGLAAGLALMPHSQIRTRGAEPPPPAHPGDMAAREKGFSSVKA